jgi:hypothetical protein
MRDVLKGPAAPDVLGARTPGARTRPRVVMPSWRRRIGLLATSVVFAASAAWLVRPEMGWGAASSLVALLALLAGISSLWSP